VAKLDTTFLSYLQWAVNYIAHNSFAIYTYYYGTDKYYKKTTFSIINFLDRNNDTAYGLPSSTIGWTIDQFCTWADTAAYSFTKQNIPSTYAGDYEACMRLAYANGYIQQRSRFKINDAKTGAQLSVRDLFLQARNCFKKQIKHPLYPEPTVGYRSRNYWFDSSLGSGLYYYTYFMKQTLADMYGPPPHVGPPYTLKHIPDWCKFCDVSEQYGYRYEDDDDFLLGGHNVTLPTGTYTLHFNTGAEPDPSNGEPGNMKTLLTIVGVQGIDSEGEITGDLATSSFMTEDPILVSGDIQFTVGPNTTGIELYSQYKHGHGEFFLYFRNYQVLDSEGNIKLIIYGRQDSQFSWTIGSGDFHFIKFTT
jgi:hypothetical protein